MAVILGQALATSIIQVALDRLASHEVIDYFKGRKLNQKLLQNLEFVLLSANSVLIYAEEKQFTNSAVKKWLDELKDAVYVADDLLDEIATEAVRSKSEAKLQTRTKKLPGSRHYPSVESLNVERGPGSLLSLPLEFFPKLKSIEIRGLCAPNLTQISIAGCMKLKSLAEVFRQRSGFLSGGGVVAPFSYPPPHFISTSDITQWQGILNCDNLQRLPEEGFPASLSILDIYKCPLLKKRYRRKNGKEWRKISHIPIIRIDREVIT